MGGGGNGGILVGNGRGWAAGAATRRGRPSRGGQAEPPVRNGFRVGGAKKWGGFAKIGRFFGKWGETGRFEGKWGGIGRIWRIFWGCGAMRGKNCPFCRFCQFWCWVGVDIFAEMGQSVGSGVAGLAQLAEHLICNQKVIGSNPIAGSIFFDA